MKTGVRFAIAACLCLLVVAAPARAQQSDDGLDLTVDARYVLDPGNRSIQVSLDASATNTLVDAEDDFGVTRFFFDELAFALPIEAEDVVARDDVGELQIETSARPADGIAEVTVALRSRLYSGQSRTVNVEFELPATPPRSDGDIRVDGAYAWFFLWAYGDPGKATVSVSVPPPFEVDVIGDPLRRTSSGNGDRLLVSGPIDDPLAWVAVISARDDERLVMRSFVVQDSTIELRSWPSDEAWAEGVEEILLSGIPEMSRLVGRSWATDLSITESIEPAVHGYSGWYVDSADSIELGEDLDPHIVLHEVSHAWFNDELFGERWITEGLADVYADAVVAATGGTRWTPGVVNRTDRGNLALNDWTDPDGGQRPSDAVEAYGYAASWKVVDAVADEIGLEGMQLVLDAAWNDVIAYQGDAGLDLVDEEDDWRRFLDLLEEVGGSTQALSLFDTWVVSAQDRSQLDARYAARARYAEVEAAAGEWALPPDLRRAMGEWRFGDAVAALDDAHRVIARRDALDVLARSAGVEALSLEARFEAGEAADVLVSELEAQEAVITNITDADDAIVAERSTFESVGLLGAGLQSRVEQAREAFSAGDLAGARESAVGVTEQVGDAERDGRIRAGVAGAVVTVLGLGGVVVTRRRRRTTSSAAV